MRYETVEIVLNGAVATLWLDRPEAANTIDIRMARDLRSAALDLEANREVRVVMLRGRGRQFSAGGDIGMFKQNLQAMPRFIRDVIAPFHEALLAFRRMPKPTLAAVHGAVAGGGLSLALVCDFVLAEEHTKFAVAYRKLGASTDGGMTHSLCRILGQRRAAELLLLSETFSAAQALAMGLINRTVAQDHFEAELASVSAALAENAPTSVGALKQLVYAAPTACFEEQLSRELEAFADCAATVDFREGIAAFLERRKPRFVGQ